ncbi:uncharacterized protein LOC133290254 [Gastrolobium bilobum]|uniref:uncharacterized protein LOC133290254 n=1 Tax=Gastrolobium bilobum TaxID=150636 RepID=UPI002AB25BEE|nr:uncharacterized protein LOC133290254 [Gastrolobium bilobum]
MEQSEDHIQKKFDKNRFLKRTLQFVFSVSVFSMFVWYSSGFSIHPQSFNACFSTCLFSMLAHTLERKYMFLFCNGILAFLAKTSLMTSSPPISDFEMVVVPLGSFESQENNVPLMVEEQVKWQEEYYEEVSEAEEEQEEGTLFNKTEGRDNEAYVAEEEEVKDEKGGTESGVLKDAQDDEGEETTMTTNEELANTDELNRKFEEFIRKMKEEIRIEAQRHLIAV